MKGVDMSFSSEVKDELSRQIVEARHCQIAEVAAIISLCGRILTNNFVSVFSGLVKCGTCGKALALRYWGRDRHRIYVCTTYAHNTKACTDHRIYYEDLYNAVLADIQYHARLAFEDREKAVLKVLAANTFTCPIICQIGCSSVYLEHSTEPIHYKVQANSTFLEE